jgi:hypothetical protein
MSKKVLIFETRHVSPVIETSFSIAEDHLEKGDEVILVNITERMPHSFSHGYGIIPRHIAKNKLNNVIRNKPEHLFYSRDPLIKCPKIQLPSFDTIKELAQFEVEGIDFGMALASTLVGKTRRLKPDVKSHRNELNLMYQTSVFALESFKMWLNHFKPDLVYIRFARMADNRPILRYCKLNHIQIKVNDIARDPNHYGLAPTLFADRTCWINYVHETWEHSLHSDEEKRQLAHAFFQRKRDGREADFNYTQHQQKGALPQNWDYTKRNIVYFTKSITESSYIDEQNDPHTLFESQIEAIDTIASILAKYPDVHFYVREHPNTHSKFRFESQSFDRFRNDGRIRFIDGNAPISTYALIDQASVVLTYMSTVGIEAIYWGKPSIVVGNSYYHQLGSVYYPQTVDELQKLLAVTTLQPLPKEAAIKYGYHCEVFGNRIRNYQATGRHSGLYKGIDLDQTTISFRVTLRVLRLVNRVFNEVLKPFV